MKEQYFKVDPEIKRFCVEAKHDLNNICNKGDVGELTIQRGMRIHPMAERIYANTGRYPPREYAKKEVFLWINNKGYTQETLRNYLGDIEIDELFKVI